MFQTPGFYGISVCQFDFGNILRSPGRIQSFPGKLSRLCCITILRTRRKRPSLHLEHAAKWAPVEDKLWNARRDAQLRFQRTQPRPHHQRLRRWRHQIMGYEYSSIVDSKTTKKREKEKLVLITFIILYKKKKIVSSTSLHHSFLFYFYCHPFLNFYLLHHYRFFILAFHTFISQSPHHFTSSPCQGRPVRWYHEHTGEVVSLSWGQADKTIFASGAWDGALKIVWTNGDAHSC